MRTLLLLIILLSPSFVALAQFNGAPDRISHQGLLTDTNGVPVSDGTYNLEFSLYTAPSGGIQLWNEIYNGGNAVSTENGLFSVELGSITPLAIPFDSLLYLGLSVNGGTELSPRTPLTAAPYALSLRNLRVFPETPAEGPNMIGGWSGNSASASVMGATIAGGGDPDVSGGPLPNSVEDSYGTIGGGIGNTITGFAGTVGGGRENTAAANVSTVGGGSSNEAAGVSSTVPGGLSNYAGGDYSFASGLGARVRDTDTGTFVWNDAQDFNTFESTGSNQFLINAAGGTGIGTNSPKNNARLHVEHGSTGQDDWGFILSNSATPDWRGGFRLSDSGFLEVTNNADDTDPEFARLSSNGLWTAVSDRRRKTDIEPALGLLETTLGLEPVTYRYKHQKATSERSLGLIAQDVQRVVPSLVEEGDVMTLNYAGLSVVALGAIKELHEESREKNRRIADLELRLAELEALVMALSSRKDETPPLGRRAGVLR